MMTEDDSFISRAKDYREPGRLASVHEKLMSPSRKKSETKKMNIEKRQNSYVIIGQNDEQLLISKGKYPESHSVVVHIL